MGDKKKVGNAQLSDNDAAGKYWPWWRIDFKQGEGLLVGSARAELSPHLVNLRQGDLGIQTNDEKSQTIRHEAEVAAINFVATKELSGYSLLNLIDEIRQRPVAGDLTILFVIEVMAWLVDKLWLQAVRILLQTYDEAGAISASVWLDIKTFLLTVKLVILYPWRGLSKSRPSGRSIRQVTYVPQASLWRQTAVFFIISLIITLPFKVIATWQDLSLQGQRLIELAGGGFRDLESASELISGGNAELAQHQLETAQTAFTQALNIVNELNHELAGALNLLPITSDKLSAARDLLSASQEITSAAELAGRTMQELNALSDEPFNLARNFSLISESASSLKAHLLSASSYLAGVSEDELPSEYATRLIQARSKLSSLEVSLASMLSLPQLLEQLLFTPGTNTYAIIFQNTSELRPTGGFAGSLALIEVSNGEINSINIPGGGPYDFQGSLSRLIRPPEPLRLVRGTWQLQDANWFFDFPTSAEKIAWFLRVSGGPDVAGVMAINSDIVVELLKLTGPIEMPAYEKVITADNFMSETQAAVDIEYDREQNRPKQFIADLAPVLFERLVNLRGSDIVKLSALINASLLKRDIQLYAKNESIEQQFHTYGWAGEVRNTTSDYLAIVRTNIGGGKTDKVVREKVEHRVELVPTGELIVRLRVTRSHYGDPHDTFESRPNVMYYRFYVPLGSNLLATQGFTPPPASYYRSVPSEAEFDEQLLTVEKEIDWDSSSDTRITEEFGKTVFANWLTVAPGESKTVELMYQLPWRADPGATWQDLRRYSLLLQRQSGMAPVDFTSQFIWPDSFRLRWQESSRQALIGENNLQLRSDWQVDERYGVILEKR